MIIIIPKANVIRHYDVTGKLCPAYWCGTAAKDAKWKSEFWDKLGIRYKVQTGAFSSKANAEAQVTKLKKAGFSAFIVKEG